jgi:hypothetical protein
MDPVGLCTIAKRKGWSARKTVTFLTDFVDMTTAVAAAASVPSSFTSTFA